MRRIIGLVLVAIGIVALLWGGIFWTDEETVLDVGSLEVTADQREGVAIPPIVAGLLLVAGIALVLVPTRKRT